MKKPDNKEVFYSLCIEDIQTVAVQELERELTTDEVNQIKDVIAAKINWYDAIADAILQNIKMEKPR